MKLVFGIVIGLSIGILTGVLCALESHTPPPAENDLLATIQKQESQINELYKRIDELEAENFEEQDMADEAQETLQAAMKEKMSLRAQLSQLKQMLENANKQIADLKKSREIKIAKLMRDFDRLEKDARKKPEPRLRPSLSSSDTVYMAKLLLDRTNKILRVLKIGQGLSAEAIAELRLDEDTVAILNKLLKDEESSAADIIAQFLQNNMAAPPANLSEMDMPQLLETLIPEIEEDLDYMKKLPFKDRISLASGKKDHLDYLSRTSKTMKVAYALHLVRQDTYAKTAQHLPNYKRTILKVKYLPPNDFLFEGCTSLTFGSIDWEKER